MRLVCLESINLVANSAHTYRDVIPRTLIFRLIWSLSNLFIRFCLAIFRLLLLNILVVNVLISKLKCLRYRPLTTALKVSAGLIWVIWSVFGNAIRQHVTDESIRTRVLFDKVDDTKINLHVFKQQFDRQKVENVIINYENLLLASALLFLGTLQRT